MKQNYKIGDLLIRDHDDHLKGQIAIIIAFMARSDHYRIISNKSFNITTWSSEYFKKLK